MKKWFISDTHFSHANIIRYTGRLFENIEEMNRCLIKNWNDCIDVGNQVFFLGDFGLGDADHLHSICSQLKGHKICIRRNQNLVQTLKNRMNKTKTLGSNFFLQNHPIFGIIKVWRGDGSEKTDYLDWIEQKRLHGISS